jgi:hypothetical protein
MNPIPLNAEHIDVASDLLCPSFAEHLGARHACGEYRKNHRWNCELIDSHDLSPWHTA